jgi:hypothetical protein
MYLALDSHVTLDSDALSGLNLLVSFVLPLIVGVVTKQITKPVVKRNLLYVLSLITGVATTIVSNGGSFDVKDTILGVLVSYGVAQGGYSAILKPSGAAELVAKASDKVGVGAVIAPDPTALALEQGTVVPAPTVVPAEQVVDTEGQQAEEIADETVDAAGDPVAVDDEPNDVEVPYDEEIDPDVAVIDADSLPAEDPDAPK